MQLEWDSICKYLQQVILFYFIFPSGVMATLTSLLFISPVWLTHLNIYCASITQYIHFNFEVAIDLVMQNKALFLKLIPGIKWLPWPIHTIQCDTRPWLTDPAGSTGVRCARLSEFSFFCTSEIQSRCISLVKDMQSHHCKLLRQVVVNGLGGN